MSYSTTTVSTLSTSAYEFKYFPRYGRWTKEMQVELDEHSRRMAKLMMHVQDMHKSKDQKVKDMQREDTDEDCIGSPISSSPMSTGATSPSMSPQPIQESVYYHAAPIQYPMQIQGTYYFQSSEQNVPIHQSPPGFQAHGYSQYHY